MKLVQLLWIVYTIVHREIILKAAVIFPGRLAAGDTLRAQALNILHSVKGGPRIENMGRLAAAVADNAVCGFLKSPSFQRGSGDTGRPGRPSWACRSFSFCFSSRRFGLGDGRSGCPSFPEHPFSVPSLLRVFFVGTISDLAEQFIGIFLEVQQIIHIYQHFLGLLILTLLQFLLEVIESTDTVRTAVGCGKTAFLVRCRFSDILSSGHTSHINPTREANNGLPQDIRQIAHSGVILS